MNYPLLESSFVTTSKSGGDDRTWETVIGIDTVVEIQTDLKLKIIPGTPKAKTLFDR